MPTYPYKCLVCGAPDLRLAAVADDTAVCHLCGGLMLRQGTEVVPQYLKSPTNKDPVSTGG